MKKTFLKITICIFLAFTFITINTMFYKVSHSQDQPTKGRYLYVHTSTWADNSSGNETIEEKWTDYIQSNLKTDLKKSHGLYYLYVSNIYVELLKKSNTLTITLRCSPDDISGRIKGESYENTSYNKELKIKLTKDPINGVINEDVRFPIDHSYRACRINWEERKQTKIQDEDEGLIRKIETNYHYSYSAKGKGVVPHKQLFTEAVGLDYKHKKLKPFAILGTKKQRNKIMMYREIYTHCCKRTDKTTFYSFYKNKVTLGSKVMNKNSLNKDSIRWTGFIFLQDINYKRAKFYSKEKGGFKFNSTIKMYKRYCKKKQRCDFPRYIEIKHKSKFKQNIKIHVRNLNYFKGYEV